YTDSLENNIIACVERAIHSMRPAQIFTGNGLTRFQVNRRNNIEANISDVSELKGPHDPAVPVIKIEDLSGQIIAVVFGYACHPSVLKGYYFSGDYAGFAQEELQEIYPGTETLFFQGAGGDIAAFPRETIPLAKQYGKELAIAVESVLNSDMERQPATLRTVYEEIDLPLSEPPTEEELKNLIDSHTDYVQVWARRMMAELMEKGNLINSYPFYPLRIWLLGNQPIFGLGGEPVIEYALELKRMYGNNVFVMGYANDVMAYIPSTRILQEGGYEGATSQMYFQNMPSSWDPSIELRIITAIENMSRDLGLTKLQRKIIRNNP